ncbi:hypothetical protein [Ferroacidibacillus organovorans]|uniref:Uncharacterized protein n=1 Tax=Ferroacidibacillus organovorans TaxID=1765683 RepID=A0A853KC83_9BACL|nr:hypothetical protein [Ferroacidibacillus organovorans]KYP79876.1 hypothetical protein AYJ22_02975 [Ferroacidibacillus organovorans]OAG94646.1 hypothetical protein AYW79_04640 [Ferroacidibacillus organovorans]
MRDAPDVYRFLPPAFIKPAFLQGVPIEVNPETWLEGTLKASQIRFTIRDRDTFGTQSALLSMFSGVRCKHGSKGRGSDNQSPPRFRSYKEAFA